MSAKSISNNTASSGLTPIKSGLTMADLLAKQDQNSTPLNRGQEIEGEIIAFTETEIVIDLKRKAEGIIYKKDLPAESLNTLNLGDKITSYVILPENESGQTILTVQKTATRTNINPKLLKFQEAKGKPQSFKAKGVEVNKGGLIVEIQGVRGFLPSSQVNLAQAANIEELIGQEIEVQVIEVDPAQNRLIFTHKTKVSEDTKKELSKLKVGDKVAGEVAAVLPFGIFVTLPEGIEGLVHSSEISWEKKEMATEGFKVGDKVEAKVISTDETTGRVNLSIKQLTQDPFASLSEDFQPDDVVKGEVTKITSQGVNVLLKNGVEGFVPSSKLDPSTTYEVGESTNFLVDNVDSHRRRVNLTPFLTSTEGLIYK